ncbi:hypothetical protein DFH07DRAFT_825790 [Mycena maculata]|uniref:Glycosyltransferase family 1 protein n=1 Tax=Mycena maculata TaxID=230809 RepID=A0AAD7NA84_9AGAR|nr:hypothetical protein DFH07DRAFT_825790 [Mycena maculata]
MCQSDPGIKSFLVNARHFRSASLSEMSNHHIVAMLAPAWGHTISYIHLATQLLQRDPTLAITLVQHSSMVAQMEAELSTCVYDAARLRIIGVGEKELSMGPITFKQVFGQLVAGWMENIPKLVQGSKGWPKPQALHIDFLGGGFVIEPTKEIVDPDCKILVWFSTALVSMPGALNEYDFEAIAQEIHADEARRQGRSMDDILTEVALSWNGTDKHSGLVIKFPGAPDMYDYERFAHAATAPDGLGRLFAAAQKLAKLADGYIVPTVLCLEPVGVPHCRELYRKLGQELFTVGLQTHDLAWSDAAPVPPTNAVVGTFLNNVVSQYGPRSVLYISFGSFFFPLATPQLIEALVNTLLDLDNPFPFIFALGGKMASLPWEIIDRVNSSGRGLVCESWVEQRAILQHEGVGWFLTHGGFNSITESLSQGIPLIVWPTNAEQPINAALLSSEPNPVAIELLQVRTGRQLGPSLRGGPNITGTVDDASAEFRAAFDAARGARGAVLTANARKLAKALREARAGEASEELIRLAAFH